MGPGHWTVLTREAGEVQHRGWGETVDGCSRKAIQRLHLADGAESEGLSCALSSWHSEKALAEAHGIDEQRTIGLKGYKDVRIEGQREGGM